jgi:structural hemagglutinin/hemolysin toxin protein RtxA
MNYQITIYIPQEYCEVVKEAMFKAGAGEIDHYEACAWQVLGEGQFRPMKGSTPFLGEEDRLEKVAEYKVEMFCIGKKLKSVIEAMKKAHPYEVPAYGVVRLEREI